MEVSISTLSLCVLAGFTFSLLVCSISVTVVNMILAVHFRDLTVDRSAMYAEKGVTRADKDKIVDVIKV